MCTPLFLTVFIMFFDIYEDLKRAYIMYLSEDVIVSPNKSFEIDIFGRKYNFVEGEESSLPRWVAYFLQSKGLVSIREEEDSENLISVAMQIARAEKVSPSIIGAKNLLILLKKYLSEEENERFRKNAYNVLKRLVDARAIKLTNLALKDGEISDEELARLDPLEVVFLKKIRKLYRDWYDSVLEHELEEIV